MPAPWSRANHLLRPFLGARPGRPLGCRLPQAHRCFCANQRKLPSSWGIQHRAKGWLGEWVLGWILVSIHQCPTPLVTQRPLLWGDLEAEGTEEQRGQPCSCRCVFSATLHWRFELQVRDSSCSTRGCQTTRCHLLAPALWLRLGWEGNAAKDLAGEAGEGSSGGKDSGGCAQQA